MKTYKIKFKQKDCEPESEIVYAKDAGKAMHDFRSRGYFYTSTIIIDINLIK